MSHTPPTPKPYTDADVDLVADAIVDARLQGHRDWTDRIARAVLDALAAAGRLPAAHLLPLLALTADEVTEIRDALTALVNTDAMIGPLVAPALDKLTTTDTAEETS